MNFKHDKKHDKYITFCMFSQRYNILLGCCTYRFRTSPERRLTSEKRFRKRLPCCLRTFRARQHRSTKLWNFRLGLSPPLITYAMSDVKTNGTRSLKRNVCISYMSYYYTRSMQMSLHKYVLFQPGGPNSTAIIESICMRLHVSYPRPLCHCFLHLSFVFLRQKIIKKPQMR